MLNVTRYIPLIARYQKSYLPPIWVLIDIQFSYPEARIYAQSNACLLPEEANASTGL